MKIRHCPSTNYNQRPKNATISTVVIHNISLPPRQFGGGYIEQFFSNQLPEDDYPYFKEISSLKVSSHFLITRLGEVVQFVACQQRAWHAGVSVLNGVADCNDYSIGIEMEGADNVPYTENQYTVLVDLLSLLHQRIPSLRVITGHEFISPQRKTDPSASFDWRYLEQQVLVKGLAFEFIKEGQL